MRFSKATAAAAVLAVAVAGCGSSGDKDKKDGSAKGSQPAKLTAWVMGAQNAPEDKVLNDAKTDFKAKYPNTTVEITYVPWPDATKKLQGALNTGNGPDVVEMGNDQVPGWVKQEALADVSKQFAGWTEGKDLAKPAVEGAQQDGKTYAVPWYAGVRVLWFRKDLLAKYKLQPPKTWDDLKAAAKKISDGEGGKVGGVAAPNDFTNGFLSFLWGAGGDVAVNEGGKWTAKLDTPESKKAIEYYTGLVKDGVAPKKYVATNELAGAQNDFANGKLAFYMDGGWAGPQFKVINKKFTSDFSATTIPTPTGQVGPAFAGGSDLAVWKDSKNPDAAFDLITAVASKKNAKAFADSLKFFPVFTDQSKAENYAGDPVQSAAAQQMANTKNAPVTPNWVDADQNKKIIPTMLKNIMNGGNLDSEVAKANKALTDALNTQG